MSYLPNITSTAVNNTAAVVTHTVAAATKTVAPLWNCHFPTCKEAITLADTITNKLNPFGALRDHNHALKELNTRRTRIRLISADSRKRIQEYRVLGVLTLKQTKEVEEIEKRVKSMGAVLTRLDQEISYVERDAVLERYKKMGRIANLAVPCGGRLVGVSACAVKAAHVCYFSLFSDCGSAIKSAKAQAIAKQVAIEGAKILGCAFLGFALCYMQTCVSG